MEGDYLAQPAQDEKVDAQGGPRGHQRINSARRNTIYKESSHSWPFRHHPMCSLLWPSLETLFSRSTTWYTDSLPPLEDDFEVRDTVDGVFAFLLSVSGEPGVAESVDLAVICRGKAKYRSMRGVHARFAHLSQKWVFWISWNLNVLTNITSSKRRWLNGN